MLDDALLSLSLPQRPEAAGAARKALAALNGDLHLISSERLGDAQLLVTELVTNAVRASTTDAVQLCVQATDDTLRVEVANSGGDFDPATLPMPTSLRAGGWGLRIVDVVAKRWGVERTEAGVNVWFELDRPSSPTSLPLSGEAPPPAAHAQRPQRMSTSA
jgi:anti-sigma regulatory factor (Ser/Thr protein kinase)